MSHLNKDAFIIAVAYLAMFIAELIIHLPVSK